MKILCTTRPGLIHPPRMRECAKNRLGDPIFLCSVDFLGQLDTCNIVSYPLTRGNTSGLVTSIYMSTPKMRHCPEDRIIGVRKMSAAENFLGGHDPFRQRLLIRNLNELSAKTHELVTTPNALLRPDAEIFFTCDCAMQKKIILCRLPTIHSIMQFSPFRELPR